MALGLSLVQTPVYVASTDLLVGREYERGQNIILSNELSGLEDLNRTLVEAISSRRVAEAASQELGLRAYPPERLLGGLSVEQVGETQFIRLSYSDPDPWRAREVADAFGAAIPEQISELIPGAGITTTVWERAEKPTAPASPHPMRNTILGLMLGLMLGVGLAFLLEYLDDSWRSPEDVELASGVPALGAIPGFELGAPTKNGATKNGEKKGAR
jgi:capsular polysaccharide biosynthesis protein